MVVCSCAGVTDRDIATAIRHGCDTVQAIRAHTRASSGCGQCVCDVEQMLQAAVEERPHALVQAGDRAVVRAAALA